ncbi:OLC1v1035406C1 [Oldenlandia corymbosa var. corymbosa]|uniref:OLC1v1035406C1 n=1 Tax=Oldenlandia corymbosa var. corymbosa TaxID=529605 RepID=A0AAV1CUS0_OLDCO|nr:OLC1v1035406C1 [Oldenlandia corymbosa var. corymbosa]
MGGDDETHSDVDNHQPVTKARKFDESSSPAHRSARRPPLPPILKSESETDSGSHSDCPISIIALAEKSSPAHRRMRTRRSSPPPIFKSKSESESETETESESESESDIEGDLWFPRVTTKSRTRRDTKRKSMRGFLVTTCPVRLINSCFIPWTHMKKTQYSTPEQIVEWCGECLAVFNRTHDQKPGYKAFEFDEVEYITCIPVAFGYRGFYITFKGKAQPVDDSSSIISEVFRARYGTLKRPPADGLVVGVLSCELKSEHQSRVDKKLAKLAKDGERCLFPCCFKRVLCDHPSCIDEGEFSYLNGSECTQVKDAMAPGLSGLDFGNLKYLKELELSRVPSRPPSFPVLGDVAALKSLTVGHSSISYLPPEIGHLFSSKLAASPNGSPDVRILQLAIFMDFIKGDVAFSLMKLNDRNIIQLDIKSENVFTDSLFVLAYIHVLLLELIYLLWKFVLESTLDSLRGALSLDQTQLV